MSAGADVIEAPFAEFEERDVRPVVAEKLAEFGLVHAVDSPVEAQDGAEISGGEDRLGLGVAQCHRVCCERPAPTSTPPPELSEAE